MNVKLTNAQKIKLASSADIYKIMQQVLLRENKIDRNKEHFWTIGLDNANRILYIELISLGTTTSTQVDPMQVYRVAILKGAIKIVLVHNHPSGEVRPSNEDKNITDRLVQVGKIIGIKVLDHLIISERSYNSFNDTELLKEIEQSKIFMPNYKQIAQIKKDAEKIGHEKKAKEMLKLMVANDFTVEQIVILTGIPKEEAEKLKARKSKSTKK
jgi:DNA repair protein RadC